jgi:TPR repeat protein
MFERIAFAHFVLWRGDRWYRRAWYVAPQILAVVLAVWLLVFAAAGPGTAPPDTSSDWGAPVSDAEWASTADALRAQAQTDMAAFTELKAQADAGDGNMQYDLALLYDPTVKLPRPVATDMGLALNYYRLAAAQGQGSAAMNLGTILTFGLAGVTPDTKNGIGWLTQAAKQNWPLAQYNLGITLADGIGGAKDAALALQWFQKAAAGGVPGAETQIGLAYLNGNPPYPKDPVTAVKWFLAAASDPAQTIATHALGVAYRDGTGVPKDEVEALKWFQLSADNGDT